MLIVEEALCGKEERHRMVLDMHGVEGGPHIARGKHVQLQLRRAAGGLVVQRQREAQLRRLVRGRWRKAAG